MASDKISLEVIYAECNNHLRDMDKNRDQLISFYIVLVGAFLALNKGHSSTQFMQDLGAFPALVLSLLGMLVSAAVNEFRKWHTRYSHTATLLVTLARDGRRGFEAIEREARKKVYSDTGKSGNPPMSPLQWFRKRYLWGTESYTFQASLIISSIPIYLLLKSPIDLAIQVVQSCFSISPIFSASLLFIVYLLVLNLLSAWNLYHDFKRCPWARWLLRGIRRNVDLEYNS